MKENWLFTSEYVCMGHPDKVADQVSDAILDEILRQDPYGRVACETLVKTGLIMLAGEITTSAHIDVPEVVRNTVRDIGYDKPEIGFDYRSIAVLVHLEKQSPDIAIGVNENKSKGKELGAGDQGIVYGYACDESENYMPLALDLARKLTWRLAQVRIDKTLPYLRPDGKTQVTVEYRGQKPVRVSAVVVSAQHSEDIKMEKLKSDIIEVVIKPTINPALLDNTAFYINPTGKFVMGGPQADCGMTGRKIIIDTYGGICRHGGGCFSGKDPTKVDRSGSYAARHCAKNIVAAGLASRCEIQIAYAIGVSKPVALSIDTFGTSKIPEQKILEIVEKNFGFSPAGIIDYYNLRRPIYINTAKFGHFGINHPDYTWERLEKVEILRKEAGL
jgi:S-adenosylmethionine synthetase